MKRLRGSEFYNILTHELIKTATESAGTSYGVLSAYTDRSDPQNQLLHTKLRDELKESGYEPIEATGEWKGMPDLCWMVAGIELDELVGIARRYEQETIVFCPKDGKPRVLQIGGVPTPPVSIPAIKTK